MILLESAEPDYPNLQRAQMGKIVQFTNQEGIRESLGNQSKTCYARQGDTKGYSMVQVRRKPL